MPRTYEKIKTDLLQKVQSGEYVLGTLIEPRTYKKVIIKNEKIATEEFTVSGRKIQLKQIRQKIYEKHEALGISFSCLFSSHHLLVQYTIFFFTSLF